MGGSGAFLAGAGVAVGLAAAAWFLRVAPAQDELDRRLAAAEETARQKSREAADAQSWAETERERNRSLDDRVRELEGLLNVTRSGPSPEAGGDTTHGDSAHGGMKRPPQPAAPLPQDAPEDWDRQRLNQEIENLARSPETVQRHARYPLVLRALRAQGDAGADIVRQMLKARLAADLTATAAALAEGLGDAAFVPYLLDRYATAAEPEAHRMILRALANLPGDEQLPVLRAAWTPPADEVSADPSLRRFAIHGLALRGDPVALDVARTRGSAPAALRARAVESLHARALRSEWKETSLLPVFQDVLATADGQEQQALSLLALEGFWSKDTADAVAAFADQPGVSPEIADRARRLADALRSGASRPADAGIPRRRGPKPGEGGDDLSNDPVGAPAPTPQAPGEQQR